MAFNVTLQLNKSETYKLSKSLTTIVSLSGTLKSESSIINPVILIEGSINDLHECNYMTISTFGRSYFVTDIRSVRNGLVEISGHVDVLSSFASGIRSSKAIVKRQQESWNLYLNDGVFKVYQNPNVLTKEFPSGFSTFQFILAVAGG